MKTTSSSLASAALLILLSVPGTPAAPAIRPTPQARPNAAPVMARQVAPSRVAIPVPVAAVTSKATAGANARPALASKPACTTSACQPQKGCPPRSSACGRGVAVQISTRNVGPIRSTAPVASAMATTSVGQTATKQAAQPGTPPPAPAVVTRRVAAPMTAPTPEILAAQQAELAATDRRVLVAQIKRAHDNCPQAQYDLALRHLMGQGVVTDKEQALAWLKQSAQNGHRAAQEKLAAITTEQNLPLASSSGQTLLVSTTPFDPANP